MDDDVLPFVCHMSRKRGLAALLGKSVATTSVPFARRLRPGPILSMMSSSLSFCFFDKAGPTKTPLLVMMGTPPSPLPPPVAPLPLPAGGEEGGGAPLEEVAVAVAVRVEEAVGVSVGSPGDEDEVGLADLVGVGDGAEVGGGGLLLGKTVGGGRERSYGASATPVKRRLPLRN